MAIAKRKTIAQIRQQGSMVAKALYNQAYKASQSGDNARAKQLRARADKVLKTRDRYENMIKGMRSNLNRAHQISQSMNGKDWGSVEQIDKREKLRDSINNMEVSRNTYMGLNKG